MTLKHTYDVAILGGGLAGLSLSIQLSRAGYEVILFEKEKYPFHKVCGEYVSFECWNFLEELGVPLSDWKLPHISQLIVSSPSGYTIEHKLDLGGFGISRYKLDAYLAELSRNAGTTILEETRVDNIWFSESHFHIQYGDRMCKAKMACGSFGKRSNIDVKLKRDFIRKKQNKLNNYIAVKYHIKTDFPADHIALHNFSNGYCGISKVEDEKYCLCYLTTAQNLQNNNNSIPDMERNILMRNPSLRQIFSEADFLFDKPLTISQISFDAKTQVEHHMLMAGDAAGMISPLCGNGMSMAMHGSKIAFEQMLLFLQEKISRQEMEEQYARIWEQTFGKRLKTGRFIQGMFGRNRITNYLLLALRPFPSIVNHLVKQTHGEPF
ncbi:MAG: FAD-dependent monooxygenase [Chitinophagaceae bacterium]|nr:FAD-dependent monooxygenase [Chitinophagaceae bacterium]MCW5929278.1 FAD-dependent monooxygenase [Chitinophagaceae bacterium]